MAVPHLEESMEGILNRKQIMVHCLDLDASSVKAMVAKKVKEAKNCVCAGRVVFLHFDDHKSAEAALRQWRFKVNVEGRQLPLCFPYRCEYKNVNFNDPLMDRFQVLVWNLPEELHKPEELFAIFCKYGEIFKVDVPKSRKDYRYGHVHFVKVDAAQAAINDARRNKIKAHGCVLEVVQYETSLRNNARSQITSPIAYDSSSTSSDSLGYTKRQVCPGPSAQSLRNMSCRSIALGTLRVADSTAPITNTAHSRAISAGGAEGCGAGSGTATTSSEVRPAAAMGRAAAAESSPSFRRWPQPKLAAEPMAEPQDEVVAQLIATSTAPVAPQHNGSSAPSAGGVPNGGLESSAGSATERSPELLGTAALTGTAAATALSGMTYDALQQQQEECHAQLVQHHHHHHQQQQHQQQRSGFSRLQRAAGSAMNATAPPGAPGGSRSDGGCENDSGAGVGGGLSDTGLAVPTGFAVGAAAAPDGVAHQREAASKAGAKVSLIDLLGDLMDRVRGLEQLMECPITHDRFVDPVLAADGFTYELSEIEKWVARHGTSPKTREDLRNKTLIPNRLVRKIVEALHGASN